MTWALAGSVPYAVVAWATICRIEAASPWPRRVSPGWNQLKHLLALLAVVVSA